MATAHAALYKNRKRPTPIAKAKEEYYGEFGKTYLIVLKFDFILCFSFAETPQRRSIACKESYVPL